MPIRRLLPPAAVALGKINGWRRQGRAESARLGPQTARAGPPPIPRPRSHGAPGQRGDAYKGYLGLLVGVMAAGGWTGSKDIYPRREERHQASADVPPQRFGAGPTFSDRSRRATAATWPACHRPRARPWPTISAACASGVRLRRARGDPPERPPGRAQGLWKPLTRARLGRRGAGAVSPGAKRPARAGWRGGAPRTLVRGRRVAKIRPVGEAPCARREPRAERRASRSGLSRLAAPCPGDRSRTRKAPQRANPTAGPRSVRWRDRAAQTPTASPTAPRGSFGSAMWPSHQVGRRGAAYGSPHENSHTRLYLPERQSALTPKPILISLPEIPASPQGRGWTEASRPPACGQLRRYVMGGVIRACIMASGRGPAGSRVKPSRGGYNDQQGPLQSYGYLGRRARAQGRLKSGPR